MHSQKGNSDEVQVLSMESLTQALISYKFHRLFPLSQYDLPSHNSKILSFPRSLLSDRSGPTIDATASDSQTDTVPPSTSNQPDLVPPRITQEQISQNNPDVDYTRSVPFISTARIYHIDVPNPTQT